jgi:hypothetical protein
MFVASRKQLVTDVRTVSQKAGMSGFYSAVLFCVSVCDEANELVKLAGENSILYDWRDPGYSRTGQNRSSVGKYRERTG